MTPYHSPYREGLELSSSLCPGHPGSSLSLSSQQARIHPSSIFWICLSCRRDYILKYQILENTPHILIRDNLVKMDRLKVLPLPREMEHCFYIALLELSQLGTIPQIIKPRGPILRHPLIFEKNFRFDSFPLTRNSKSLLSPLLVVGVTLT
jgi:hypothetical protein